MSRYSRIFLRQKDANFPNSWTGSPSSKVSTVEPHSTTSPGYSYPPSTSLPSRDADLSMMTPPPHPYTLGATHSPVEVSFWDGPSDTRGHNQQNTSESTTSEKQTPGGHLAGYDQSVPPREASRRVSVISQQPLPLPLHLRPAVVFLLYLPIPPLLSMIYMVAGHAILRKTQSSPTSIYHAPLLSSLEAGATGGIILAVPLALLLYLLLFPNKPPAAPEDFFEDDNSDIVTRERWLLYIGLVVAAFFVVCIGGVAGPLGVTCLSSGTPEIFVGSKRMLSSSSAAAAGFLGGVLIGVGSSIVGVVAMGSMLWMRNSKPSSLS